MSRDWTPNQLHSDLLLWIDGADPHGNNRQSVPASGAVVPIVRDKSKNKLRFAGSNSANPSTNSAPLFITSSVTAVTINVAGSGYTNGANIELNFIDDVDNLKRIRLGCTVSGGAVDAVTSFGASYGFAVGDTLTQAGPSNGTGTDAKITITAVENVNGLFFNNADFLSCSTAIRFSKLHIFALLNVRGTNSTGNYINISAATGSDHVRINFDESSDPATANFGVQYKNTSGGTSTFVNEKVEHNSHISEALLLPTDNNYIALDGTITPASKDNIGFSFTYTSYSIQLFVGTNQLTGALYEVLFFNRELIEEEREKVLGYLEHKYKQNTLIGTAKYKAAPPKLDAFFNGAHKVSPRQPVQIVKLYLDFCDNIYGEAGANRLSSCTASGSAGSECYNTRETCQDLTNYNVAVNGKRTYTFISEQGEMLTGKERDAHPALMSVTSAPVEIQSTKGVSVRANVSIKLRDFISNDADVDKYFDTRNIIALESGTYFSKLLERNPHFYGRAVEVYDGYIDYKGDLEIFDGKREYVIDSMFLDKDVCTLKCKDPMTLADELKAKVPAASRFSLGAALNSGTRDHIALKFDDVALDGSVQADKDKVIEYFGADNATGFVRIDEEILAYRVDVSGSYAALDYTGRGEWGSEAATDAYGVDDTIQKCLFFGTYDTSSSGVTVDDVAYELLVNQAGIPSKLVNNAVGEAYSWADEKTAWLSSFKINAILSEPKEVNKQLSQIGSMVGVNFFYDDLLSLIVMRAETPEIDTSILAQITDNEIIEDSVKLVNAEKDRVSRVQYYYNMRDHTQDRDKPRNFKNLYLAFDVDSESENEYNSSAIKTIYGWGVKESSTASSVSQRILRRFKQTPKSIRFKMDASQDAVSTGEHFYLKTKHILNYQGEERLMQMQCTSVKFDSKKQEYEIKAKQFRFGSTNFGKITANQLTVTAAGSGYVLNETISSMTTNGSGSGMVVKVLAIDGSGGITSATIHAYGTNYAVANTLSGGSSSGSGSSATFTLARLNLLTEGTGSGTEADPYAGARATECYLADANHITVELLSGGTGFQDGQTIEFKPDETQAGAAANTRNLTVTYTQSGGAVTAITAVTSNAATNTIPSNAHDGYSATEILTGESSTGSNLSVRITKRARMSDGSEPYLIV